MRPPRLALIGAGSRGSEAYGSLVASGAVEASFVAAADPDSGRLASFAARHHIPSGMAFSDWRKLFGGPKLADAVLICSPDAAHFEQATAALAAGYHVLLEKPMSTDPAQCAQLGEAGRKSGLVFMICHVLRYSPFFSAIKGLLDSGAIGDLISISHSENIGYWHFAHSFVRGNWGSSSGSGPLMLTKSSHDMDILLWLSGRDCSRLASFGSLSAFKSSSAPKGSGERCSIDCRIEPSCPYSAKAIYHRFRGGWPSTVVSLGQERADIDRALAEGPYGRCVYRCGNDVVDHQSSILEFEGGLTAAFSLSAFTGKISRTIKLMGSLGEIRGDMEKNDVELIVHGGVSPTSISPEDSEGGHGGGDLALLRDFIEAVRSGDSSCARTRAEDSVQGHLMAFAAEKSRLEGRAVDMAAFAASCSASGPGAAAAGRGGGSWN